MPIIGVAGAIPSAVTELVAAVSRSIPVRWTGSKDHALVIVDSLGGVTAQELAQSLGAHERVGYRLLAELGAQGFAARPPRTRDPLDRRRGVGRVVLTPSGHEAAGGIRDSLRRKIPALPEVCRGVDGSLAASLALCRLDTLGSRILVALPDGSMTYAQLRAATGGGERDVRAAVQALRARGVERHVVAEARAMFRFSLSDCGRESAARIISEIDAAIRTAALALAVSAARAS